MQGFESLVSRLETVTVKLESMAKTADAIEMPQKNGSSKSLEEFKSLISGQLAQFIEFGSGCSDPIPQMTGLVKSAFEAQLDLISVASNSAKPSAKDLPGVISPLQISIGKITSFRNSNRGSPYFSHLSVVSEGIPALGWVVVEPTPVHFIGEMKEAGQFYANRVIKDFKDKDKKSVEWVGSFLSLLTDLQGYVKQFHTTGLVWNSAGVSAKANVSVAPSGHTAPSAAPKTNFLKELGGATSSLRKVEKFEMTHKNPELRASSVVKESETSSKISTPLAKSVKTPKLELQGNKWIVENYTNDASLVIDKTEIRHTVYIYNCTNCTVMIKGKVNAVSIDGCKKTGILIDNVVSTIDIVNGKSITVQIAGKAPTMAIDKTDGIQIYLSKESLDLQVLTAKSSALNFMVPTHDGDYVELAAPEQLKIQLDPLSNKLNSVAVEHQ